jgi:hypothetical protein
MLGLLQESLRQVSERSTDSSGQIYAIRLLLGDMRRLLNRGKGNGLPPEAVQQLIQYVEALDPPRERRIPPGD